MMPVTDFVYLFKEKTCGDGEGAFILLTYVKTPHLMSAIVLGMQRVKAENICVCERRDLRLVCVLSLHYGLCVSLSRRSERNAQ